MPKTPSLFFVIKSVNEETREVGGLLTQQKADKDGEQMDYFGSKPNFQQWSLEAYNATTEAGQEPSFGNLRVQHSKQCVGKFNAPLIFDDDAKSIWGQAKVYDDDTWEGVKGGVYTGFSVGGNLGGPIKKVGNQKFFTIIPREVSLVDNPAVDSAHFDYIRAADGQVIKTAFVHRTKAEATGDAVISILKAADYSHAEVSAVLDHVKENFDEELSEAKDDEEKAAVPCPCSNPACTGKPGCTCGDPGCTCNKGTMSAVANPDAVPDQSKETSQPVEDNHGKQPDPVVVTTPNPKSETPFGDPDTQLGKHDSEPQADYIVKVSPPGWSDTVEAMKEHSGIDNPYALAWYMEGEGYTPHKMSKAAFLEFNSLFKAATGPDGVVCKRDVSDKERAELADKGHAMPDGSYPIASASDLSNAVQAIGRAKDRSAVMAHIKRRAAALGRTDLLPDSWEKAPADMIVKSVGDLERSGLLPDNWKKVVENKLSTLSVGANNMSKENEISKAARLGLTGHLQNLKGHADKCKAAVDGFHAAIHDACDKCMKLAGPAFDADSEHEGGQPASGEAVSTEVKAAKAEIEKLSAAVKAITDKFEASEKSATEAKDAAEKLAKAEVEKAAKAKSDAEEAEKVAKAAAAASVVGDPTKAVKSQPTVEKLAADKKEQEELLAIAKSAMGVGPNGTKVNADPKALDALYNKLTNATQYQAARKYMRAGQ